MSKIPKFKASNLYLLVILLSGFVLRLYHLSFGIGTHPDERHMIGVAEGLSLADPNPHSFAYGSFPYYLLWMASELLGYFWPGLKGYDGLFLVGRSLCTVFGMLGVYLTYLLAHRLYRQVWLSLLAAAFLSFNFFHIQLSRYFTSDVILSTLSIFALLNFISIARTGKYRDYFLSGVSIGLALATKISALILFVPFLAGFVADLIQNSSFRLKPLVLKLGFFCFALVITFFVFEPYAFFDFETFLANTREQTGMARGLWRPPYTVQYEGTVPYLYHLSQMFHYTMGWPIALVSFIGFLFCLVRQVKKTSAGEIILILWIGFFFLLTAGLKVKFPRYLLPIYPELLILGARWIWAPFLSAVTSSPISLPKFSPIKFKLNFSYFISPLLKYSLTFVVPLVLSCFCLFVTMISFRSQEAWWPTLLSWIAACGALLLLAWLWDLKQGVNFKLVYSRNEAILFFGVLFLAFLVRIMNLNELPFHLHNDEMSVGLEARKFLSLSPPLLFSNGWLSQPNLGFFIQSLGLGLFGDNLFGLRFLSIIFSLLSLFGIYHLFKLFFDKHLALVAMTLAAFSHLHIHYSRTGYQSMLETGLLVWSVYSVLLGWCKKSYFFLCLGGILLSLAYQTGAFGHVGLVILLIWGLVGFIFGSSKNCTNKNWTNFKLGLVVVLAFILVSLPYFTFLATSSFRASQRALDLYVFSLANIPHVSSVVGSAQIKDIVSHQIQQILKFLIQGFDASPHYGMFGALMDPVLLVFSVVGLVIAFTKLRNEGVRLVFIFLGVVLVFCGVLTIDTPFSPRLLLLSPLIYFFPALAISRLTTNFSKWGPYGTNLAHMLSFLIVIFSSLFSLQHYFINYSQHEPKTLTDTIVHIYLKHPNVKVIINGTDTPENFSFESYQFLAPIKGENLKLGQALSMEALLAHFPSDSPLLFLTSIEAQTLDPSLIRSRGVGIQDFGVTQGARWYVLG